MKTVPRFLLLLCCCAATATVVGCDRKMDSSLSSNAASSADPSNPGANASAVLASNQSASQSTHSSTSSASASSSGGALSTEEQTFLKSAAGSGLYEVSVAKIAQEKSSNPEVKSMATTLVQDHSQANDQLAKVAGTRVALPTTIPPEKQKIIDELRQATGHEFDQQFVKTVGLQDHQADIVLFESAQNTAKDPAVQNFVQTNLPILRHHLAMAQDLAKTVGAK